MAEQGSAAAEFVKPGKGRVANRDKVPSGRKGVEAFTPKEAKFAKALVTEVIPGKKTKRQAAMEAYNTTDPKVATAIATENLAKPRFKALMAEAMEKAGMTPASMATVLQDAMQATKTASFQGEVMPSDEPDHTVRVAAVRAAAAFLTEDEDDPTGKPQFNFFGGQTFVNKQQNVITPPENS